MIDQYIRSNSRRFASRKTIWFGVRAVTFGDLDDHVDRMCAHLAAHGVGRGDRVLVIARNSVEFVQVMLACLRSGAVLVPVNTRLAEPEIEYLVRDTSPTAVVVDRHHEDIGRAVAGPATVLVVDRPWEQSLPVATLHTDAPPAPDAPAMILYTSGTTGRPKGAVLSHQAVLINSLSVLGRLGMYDPAECRHVGVPLFHSGGINSVLQQLLLGGPLVLMPQPSFDPVETLDALECHRVATAFFAPSQWEAICRVPGVRDRDLRLKRIIWGTSSTPRHVLELLHETFTGIPVFAQFGQTETCGTTCSLGPADASRKLGSVGKPLTHVQLRVVDREMVDVGPGEVGEIVYRGPTVLSEYWNNPTATAEAFVGGWFHSGDLGVVDEEGFLTIAGRLKELIISGGENIYPLEVEAAVVTHPKVREVAVVGLPHPRWVESPVAVVVPVDPADPPTLPEIQAHLQASLASFKKPTALCIVEVLPRNASGKIVKGKARELAAGIRAGESSGGTS